MKTKELNDGRSIPLIDGLPALLECEVRVPEDDPNARCLAMFMLPIEREDIDSMLRDLVEARISVMPEFAAQEAREKIGDDWSLEGITRALGGELDLPSLDDVALAIPVPLHGDNHPVYMMGLN